ncbi:hypothetical protein DFP72DRAFT_1118884 [Ephemerocybe angulata]|uniref:DUF6534 domain-containing protein n=1 Tax=Ephemerocybe angulata TaxID=980116 RepID=A0A8H6I216_9AGAR|nr:hypothetical protein DFP72DRAFT_1118884 [Tulosesus angulatus]
MVLKAWWSFTAGQVTMRNPALIAHGPMLIGFTLNAVLFGIMITQVYLYFTTYKKDRLFLKLLVLFLLVADTVNTVFDFLYLYHVLIQHFGETAFLEKADWHPIMTGIIATTVQLFFAWRIRVLTKNWFLVCIVTTLAVAGFVGAAVATYDAGGATPKFLDFRNFKVWRFDNSLSRENEPYDGSKAVVILWLTSESVGDMLITGILVRFLCVFPRPGVSDNKRLIFHYRRKHKTGFKNSDMMVDRIIRVTVQTGLVTSIVAILDLVFFLADAIQNTESAHWNLYSNSMMSSLNSRKGWHISTEIEASEGAFTEESFHTSSLPMDRTTGTTSTGGQLRSFLPSSPKVNCLHFGPNNRPEIFVSVESHEVKDAIEVLSLTARRHRRRRQDSQGRQIQQHTQETATVVISTSKD